MLINLISNAVKFTNAGEISLRVTPADAGKSGVEIQVRDTGIGISPEIQSRLFQPFMQADTSISRRFGGTGLGLSISKHIVTMMGGTLALESVPGVGTTIKLWLPLAVRFAQRPAPDAKGRLAAGCRVLVVDDRETNRDIVSAYLASFGVQTGQAANAGDALARLEEASARGTPYSLAIVDLLMPGTDGLELCRQIKSAPRSQATRLVLLSSLTWSEHYGNPADAGVERLLHKPIRRSELERTIRELAASEPAKTEQAAGPQDVGTERRPLSLNVLVAEDNPVNQLVISEYLTSLGCTATCVDNGLHAVRAFERETFDVILMDCQMPEMDGISATRHIREREQGVASRRTPILAVSAHAFEEDRRRCANAGMDGYITKPFSEEQLYTELVRWKAAKAELCAASQAPITDLGDEAAAGRIVRSARPELHTKLVRIYLDYAPTLISTLGHAQRGADLPGLKLAAHSLKFEQRQCRRRSAVGAVPDA